MCWSAKPEDRPTFEEIAEELRGVLDEANYQNRSKTKDIKDDYYLETVADRSEVDGLYLEVLGDEDQVEEC